MADNQHKNKSTFDKIKEQNGEKFAKAIRGYDSGIFDVPNIVNIVKYAGYEAEPIMQYLISMKNIEIDEHGVYETPFQLLDKAGYDAFYADTLEKQNSIRPYFAKGEELCTFKDARRFENYYIIHALKKDVDKIKRDDFLYPEREDEYGRSVISIQISKKGGFIKITNRYNHAVANPDNTFNSNPDMIIPGLSESICRFFKVDFSCRKPRLPEGYVMYNGQVLKYHTERNNTYFGENFFLKDGIVCGLDKRTDIMLDAFVFNNQNKVLSNPAGLNDAFVSAFMQEIEGKKVRIDSDKETGHKLVCADGAQILDVYEGKIIGLHFPAATEIGDGFLMGNETVRYVSLPNVEKIGDDFMYFNDSLASVNMPNVVEIGDNFIHNNRHLCILKLPAVEYIGYDFLSCNRDLEDLQLPAVKEVRGGFLEQNEALRILNCPYLEEIGDFSLIRNKSVISAYMPSLRGVGEDVLIENPYRERLFRRLFSDNVGFGSFTQNDHCRE